MQTPDRTLNATAIARVALLSSLALIAGAALCGCGSAKISRERELGAAPAGKPAVIYIADFQLDPSIIESNGGLLPALPGPLGEILPPLPGTRKNPERRARALTETMSTALTKDIGKAGFHARRLSSSEAMPSAGWLVRGVFTHVHEGNQLSRAVIGFGAGKTDLQVLVDINDLGQGAPKPFYQLDTTADSGKAPGAGPTIVLGPAGVAARFIIAGKDLDQNVKQSAARIAEAVVGRVRSPAEAAKRNHASRNTEVLF